MIPYKQFIDDKLLMKKNLEKLLNEFNLKRFIITANTFWIDEKYTVKIELFESNENFENIFNEHLSDNYILHTTKSDDICYITKKES